MTTQPVMLQSRIARSRSGNDFSRNSSSAFGNATPSPASALWVISGTGGPLAASGRSADASGGPHRVLVRYRPRDSRVRAGPGRATPSGCASSGPGRKSAAAAAATTTCDEALRLVLDELVCIDED